MDRGAPDGLLDTAETRLPRQQGAARPLARAGPAALRDHAALRADLDRGAARGGGCLACASTPTPTCRPIWPRTSTRSRPPGGSTRRPRATPTSTTATACSGRARCSATASIWTRRSWQRLSATRSIAVFCPTSNLFIGSGLFDLAMLRDPARPVRVGLATDVGGGTSYSMLRTAAEAYKVLQLRRQNLPALDAFYLMTLGNARCLGLDDRIGSLAPGREADLVVLDAARHAGHGASDGDDRGRSRRGAVRAHDHGRRPRRAGDLRRRRAAARGVVRRLLAGFARPVDRLPRPQGVDLSR